MATLPVKKDKSPYNVSTWIGGITDESKYEGAYGVGLVCGKISGGLECLDFDNHFGDAKDTLTHFIEEIKDIFSKYKFPIESSSGGGFHLIYRCSEIEGNRKLASKPKWDEKRKRFVPDAIIETKGEGGYFVAYPTEGYNVERNNFLDIPEITVEDRQQIIDVAKSFNKWYEEKKTEYEDSDRPGDLFNKSLGAKDEVEDELRRHEWVEVRDGQWRRPGKDKGISATLGKAADNIFYVFSSNAYPFEPESGYNPFRVIGLLKYNGDFKKFAKELSEKYSVKKPEKRNVGEVKDESPDEKRLEGILSSAYIDPTIPITKPPVCFKIRDYENGAIYEKRLFTLGNFSAIIGKSKSKKSFLASAFLAAATKNGIIDEKILCDFPDGRNDVLLFDTEQSRYDAYVCSERVIRLTGIKHPRNFISYDLREYSPRDRRDIIGYALKKHENSVGYVVIDGIADLVNSINDEEEAAKIVTLLMQWTTYYNCHITNIIHQNKNDNWATGWVGSLITKKSECVISVAKDDSDKYKSKVSCDFMRGVSDFDDFELEIYEGMPHIGNIDKLSSGYEIKSDDIPF